MLYISAKVKMSLKILLKKLNQFAIDVFLEISVALIKTERFHPLQVVNSVTGLDGAEATSLNYLTVMILLLHLNVVLPASIGGNQEIHD